MSVLLDPHAALLAPSLANTTLAVTTNCFTQETPKSASMLQWLLVGLKVTVLEVTYLDRTVSLLPALLQMVPPACG